MLKAYDENRNKINACNASRRGHYTCPKCGEIVIPKALKSISKHPYFSHVSGSECDWHDKGEWHCEWQMRFPEDCQEEVCRKDDVKHIADVLVNNTVIEFQHSYISPEEFHARNEFYLGCGYRLIWVFDMPDKIKRVGHGTLELKRQKDTLVGYSDRKDEYDILLESDGQLYLLYSDASSDRCKNTFLCYKDPITKERFVQAVSMFDSSQFPRLQQRLEKLKEMEELAEKLMQSTNAEQKKESRAAVPAFKTKPPARRRRRGRF